MDTVVQVVLQLVMKLLPSLGGNAQLITTIINALITIMPVLVKEYKDTMPEIKNIIAALTSDSAVTAEHRVQLRQLSAIADADFDDAVAAAEAEDAAALLAGSGVVTTTGEADLDSALKS